MGVGTYKILMNLGGPFLIFAYSIKGLPNGSDQLGFISRKDKTKPSLHPPLTQKFQVNAIGWCIASAPA